MLIDKLNEDLSFISALSDRPNDNGMSAAELKEKFDKAGNTIKEYINSTLDGLNFDSIGTVVYSYKRPSRDAVLCDGRQLEKKVYQSLYFTIGSRFGQTETTFAVPTIAESFDGLEAYILSGVVEDE